MTIFSGQSVISRVYTSRFGNGTSSHGTSTEVVLKKYQVPGTVPSGKPPKSEPYRTVPCRTMQWKSAIIFFSLLSWLSSQGIGLGSFLDSTRVFTVLLFTLQLGTSHSGLFSCWSNVAFLDHSEPLCTVEIILIKHLLQADTCSANSICSFDHYCIIIFFSFLIFCRYW